MAPDQTVLLVRTHKWGDRWGLPGGKIEAGESLVSALKREIREETGLSIHGIRFACVQECVFAREFYKRKHMILINYFARSRSKSVSLNEEAEDFRWVSPRAALRMRLNQPTRYLLHLLK